MSKFYFFTDVRHNGNLISSQTSSNQAFGPIDDMNYRVCSLHTLPVNAKAYAICDGILFARKIPGTNELNIALKPTVQPRDHDFGFIKWIIYRNIKADSLINGTEIAAASSNDLTAAIWDSFEKLKAVNTEIDSDDKPGIDCLGLNTTLNNDDPLEYAFYRGDESVLFNVEGGWHIGDFSGGSKKAGIEIVFDNLGYEPPLSLLELDDHVINITITKNDASINNPIFWHQHEKEEILNYIDPCSFYGALYHEGIRVPQLKNASHELAPIGDFDMLISFFHNNNIAYLSINNNHQRSYNYYNDFKLAGNSGLFKLRIDNTHFRIDPENLYPVDYYDDWPLFRIEWGSGTYTGNHMHISLPMRNKPVVGRKDINRSPRIYYQSGYFKGRLFSSIPPKNRIGSIIYQDGEEEGEYLSEVITVTLGPRDEQGNIKFIPILHKFIFHQHWISKKILDDDGETFYTGISKSFLSYMFPINGMPLLFEKKNQEVVTRVYNNKIITDHSFTEYGFKGVYRIGVAEDENNITFFAFSHDFYSEIKDVIRTPGFMLSQKIKDVDFLFSLTEENSHELVINEMNGFGENHNLIRLKETFFKDGSQTPAEFLKYLHAIVIAKSEYQKLLDVINTIKADSKAESNDLNSYQPDYLFYLGFSSGTYETNPNKSIMYRGDLSVVYYNPFNGTSKNISPLMPQVEAFMHLPNH